MKPDKKGDFGDIGLVYETPAEYFNTSSGRRAGLADSLPKVALLG